MTDGLDWEITGLNDVLGRMEGLPIALRTKGFRYAGRKAANVIREAAVANARRIDDPATAEIIAENIVVRFSARTFARTKNVMFRIGVLGGARQYANTKENRRKQRVGSSYQTAGDKANPGGDTWYWRFPEFGTANMAATPFLRPALQENQEKATDEFVSQLDKWLVRNLKKITKKGL